METIFDVAVIGAGGAGQMAVLRAVLNHLKTVVFWGDPKTAKRSRAAWVTEVDNIPGLFDKKRPIAATSREVIQFVEKNADLNRFLTVIKKAAGGIKQKAEIFEITAGEETVKSRFVVLCTGTMDVQPHIGGSIQPILPYANLGDVLYCIRCDGHKTVGQDCAVIGHEEDAGWIAIMLKERYDLPKLYVLTHGKPFEGTEEVNGLLDRYGIRVVPDEITGILGDPKQGLKGFEIGEQTVPVTKAFVALGSLVYNDLAKQLDVKLSDNGHVLTDEYGETSTEGFFAAGDLVEGKKKQVYTAWDTAVDAVDTIDEKIRALKRNGHY